MKLVVAVVAMLELTGCRLRSESNLREDKIEQPVGTAGHAGPTSHAPGNPANHFFEQLKKEMGDTKEPLTLKDFDKNQVWFGEGTNRNVSGEFRTGQLISVYTKNVTDKKQVRIGYQAWDSDKEAKHYNGKKDPLQYSGSDLASIQRRSTPSPYNQAMEKATGTQTYDTDVVEAEKDGLKILKWETKMKVPGRKNWEVLYTHELIAGKVENGKRVLFLLQLDQIGNPFWVSKLTTERDVEIKN